MTRADLLSLLSEQGDREFVDRILLGRRPWIFEGDAEYAMWRGSVADTLKISPDGIRIVGSAATGYSLSPLKPGRPFRPFGSMELVARAPIASDIDIALIDPNLFSQAWNVIISLDRAYTLGGTDESRGKIRFDIYHGLVGQQSIPLNTSPARRFLTAITVAGRSPPLRGYKIRGRVYRRIEDLRSYHVNSLRQLRRELAL